MTLEELETVPATAAPGRFDELLRRAVHDRERVILTEDGKPVAALVPFEDAEFLEAWEDEIDLRTAEAVMADPEASKTRPWDEVAKELGA